MTLKLIFVILTAGFCFPIFADDRPEITIQDLDLSMHAVPADIEAAPLWEQARPSQGRNWSLFAFNVIRSYGENLKAGAKDVKKFCPRFYSLSENQKLNFWAYLVSAMVKFESNFDPTSRFLESTMGIDPVTQKKVYSEGLLQLSYQDGLNYSFCNEFNWTKDQHLSPTSPQKTILDPYKNLKCGIRILDRIVGRKKYIAFNTGHYWSVLKPKNSKQAQIAKLTKRISFCS